MVQAISYNTLLSTIKVADAMIFKHSELLAVVKFKRKPLKWRLHHLSLMLLAKSTEEKESHPQSKNRKPHNSHRNRDFAVDEITRLSDLIFTRMFRVDRDSFYELVENIEIKLIRNEVRAKSSSGSSINTITRLAVTLRWLAGASYLDLCFAWGVSKTSFFGERGVLWPTNEALDELLQLGFPLNDEYALSM